MLPFYGSRELVFREAAKDLLDYSQGLTSCCLLFYPFWSWEEKEAIYHAGFSFSLPASSMLMS